MSRHDYLISSELQDHNHTYTALIMTAMRVAPDTEDLDLLRDAYPHIWTELITRFQTPGGYLPDEQGAA
jgi:hypothetical protein